MLEIPLAAIPNQAFTVALDGHNYAFKIYAIDDCMAVDLTRDNTLILSGQRVVANFPIIPYGYLENGNFIFDTFNDDLPYYTQFGITQSLIYASALELSTLRAGI